MKLIILKENLKQGLEIIEKIIGKNLTLPILNNILISTEKNLLKLSGTDLEIGINYWALCKIENQGEITIPAKFMYNFINSLPAEKINLEVGDKIIHISCENYKTQIKGESVQDFPIIPKIETENFIEVNSSAFCHGISQVIDFTAQSQTRPELSGIFFNFKKNQLSLASTDSFRLAEKIIGFEKEINQEYSFILPRKTAYTIMNIFSQKQQKIKIYFSSNQILFETRFMEIPRPNIQVISRLIDGEYPNYKEIIPENFETRLTVSKDKFLNQIKTASLFSGKINEIKIKIKIKEQEMQIFSQNPDLGENFSCLKIDAQGKDVEVSFNWRYLLEGFSHFKSSEITAELNSKDGPVVFKPKGDQTYLYVVMPIKGM